LIPALGKARVAGRALKEQSAAHQKTIAYESYTTDMRDSLLVAAPHWCWNHTPRVREGMYPPDPWQKGVYMEGSITKTWLWHFIGATGYEKSVIQLDTSVYADFFRRPNNPGITVGFTGYGSDTYAAALSYHPSLGYNGVFLGGAYTHGAFRGQLPCAQVHGGPAHSTYGHPEPAGNPRSSGGTFYVRKGADVRYPSTVITFASSRGSDVREGGFWGWGQSAPNTTGATAASLMRPGYWLITAPRRHPQQRGGANAAPTFTWASAPGSTTGGQSGWSRITPNGPASAFNKSGVPSDWGMVDFRWGGKAVTAMHDGSVKMQSVSDMDDMRKWSNHADSPQWDFPTDPNQYRW
jgi:hypothetical protein